MIAFMELDSNIPIIRLKGDLKLDRRTLNFAFFLDKVFFAEVREKEISPLVKDILSKKIPEVIRIDFPDNSKDIIDHLITYNLVKLASVAKGNLSDYVFILIDMKESEASFLFEERSYASLFFDKNFERVALREIKNFCLKMKSARDIFCILEKNKNLYEEELLETNPCVFWDLSFELNSLFLDLNFEDEGSTIRKELVKINGNFIKYLLAKSYYHRINKLIN
jgi:hypothetical protein